MMGIQYIAKMGICPFRPKDVAKCPYSETIWQNTSVLKFDFSNFNVKLDWMKIELFGKIHMELEFHKIFF